MPAREREWVAFNAQPRGCRRMKGECDAVLDWTDGMVETHLHLARLVKRKWGPRNVHQGGVRPLERTERGEKCNAIQ